MKVQRRVYTFFEDRTLSITYISQGSPYTVHLLQSQRGKEFASTLFLQPGASYEQGKWSDPWTLMPDIIRLSGTSCDLIIIYGKKISKNLCILSLKTRVI